MSKYKYETTALHAAYNPAENLGSRAVPIHPTTSYVFKDAQYAADLFTLKEPGYIYTRLGNPTLTVLEERLAAYHQAAAALSFSSGSAANAFLFMALANPGQNIVASPYLYGGTATLLTHTLPRLGINARFVDLSDRNALLSAIDDQTVAVFGEVVANPSGHIIDLEKVAAAAHDLGLPFIVDNTSTPPPIINPFDYGADLLTYSLTKMVAGHGTHLGGLIVEKGDFNWGSARFPNINGPDPGYGNLNFWEKFGAPNYQAAKSQVICLKLRTGLMRDFGPTLSPFGAHEILLGLETLPLRAARHVENARLAAEYLAAHPKVAWVSYAGLAAAPQKNLVDKYFKGSGPGAVFGFGLKGGYDAAAAFIEKAGFFSHLANILDARTLIIHPASTTHQQLSSAERAAAGVPDDMLRLSVGLEHIDDIIAVFDQAL